MRSALVAEYRKFFTTRMWWVLLATMTGYMGFIAGVMAFSLASDPSGMNMGGSEVPLVIPPLDLALAVYTLAPTLGYVFPVIVGAMSVTGEFRHQTVTPTFLAEPRRGLVLGAKLVASIPMGILYGLTAVAATVGIGAGVLAAMGKDAMLGEPEVLRTALWSAVALTIWTVVGVGFGAALKNQVVSIVVILAFTQLVEPVMRVALGMIDGAEGIAKWLPGSAGEAIAGSSFYNVSGLGELLDRGPGIAVLIAYGLVLAAIGRFTTFGKDIT